MKSFMVMLSIFFALSATAEVPTVLQTADGGLYIVLLHSSGVTIEKINGCEIFPPVGVVATWSDIEKQFKTTNLRNVLATGTTTLRSGQDRIDVPNDRTIKIGEMTVVATSAAGREVQVEYELPVLSQQIFGWTFRRLDGTIASSAGTSAFNFPVT